MKKDKSTKALVESGILIALAAVLSIIKLVDLPYGGSITIASMLPVIIISYRWGLGWGVGSGLVYGIVEQLLGLKTLSWVTTWQSILAVILLDYVVAFCVTGFGGIFRKNVKNQTVALTLGCVLACVLRYACHVVSGATVWQGISIPTQAALVYSFVYNATYMIPETIILLIVTIYLSTMIDFRQDIPTRMKNPQTGAHTGILSAFAGLCVTGGLVFDIMAIFAHLQNEDGEFDIGGLSAVNWVAVIAVSVICALAAAIFIAIRYATKNKADKNEV